MLVRRARILGLAACCALGLLATAAAVAAHAASDPQAVRIVVIAAAVVIGIVIGLIPALLLGMVLGLAPRPRVARLRRRLARADASAPPPGAGRPRPVPIPLVFDPHPVEQVAVPLRTLMPAQVHGPLPAPVAEETVASRERHQELYDVEYSEHLRRIETLRRTISIRLAVPASSPADAVAPPAESDE
jgi:hypothetical protein